jgi:hypothetical protein
LIIDRERGRGSGSEGRGREGMSFRGWVHGCRLQCSKIQYFQVSIFPTFSALETYKFRPQLLGLLSSERL